MPSPGDAAYGGISVGDVGVDYSVVGCQAVAAGRLAHRSAGHHGRVGAAVLARRRVARRGDTRAPVSEAGENSVAADVHT